MSLESAPIGVIILNWNATDDTLACLRSLADWQPAPHVWVVDNASCDGGDPIAAAFPSVRLIRSPVNLGFAGGNNLGIKPALQAGCEFVLLLNNDARLTQSDLDRLIDALHTDASTGVVGPVLRQSQPPQRVLSAGGRDIAWHVTSHEVALPQAGCLKDVDYVPGTVVLIRADVLRRVGLFDDGYFFGGEMADLCERARQAGYRSVIHPQAQSFHDVQRSSALRDSLHVYYVLRNRFLFIGKFRSRRRTRLFVWWTALGCAMAMASLLRGNVRRARAIGLGVWHGLTGRFGGRNEQVWPGLKTTL